ncbi:MAG: prepilin-type N-terminal cleavage/methylation domain-containing protein [Oscillospiraceae bacterium]|nr:prepilin-type N-terminal cleavage/methylation domain-containing protein [Oscillospiraceae bacterium]
MDIKSSGSAYKRIKGFTLVELIVVIAIIVILAGITNLVTQSFVKNARTETANDKARLLFTGFQNVLTQCEIKQDSSALSYNDSNVSNLGLAIISVKLYNGSIQYMQVDNYSLSGTTATSIGSAATKFTAGYLQWDPAKPLNYTGGLSKAANAIAGIVDTSFEGEAKIYIDYENYEVKSVVYRQLADSDKNQTSFVINTGDLTQYGSWYYGYADRQDQEAKYKSSGVLYGVYPFQKNLGIIG